VAKIPGSLRGQAREERSFRSNGDSDHSPDLIILTLSIVATTLTCPESGSSRVDKSWSTFLAAAIRAEKDGNLSWLDAQGDAIQCARLLSATARPCQLRRLKVLVRIWISMIANLILCSGEAAFRGA